MNETETHNPNGDTGAKNFLPDESFQAVPSILLKDLRRLNAKGKPVLEHMDIAVYALLKAHSRMKGECHPSLLTLANLAACSVATMQRSLKRLDAAGHIQRKKHNRGKIFVLTDVTANSQVLRKPRKVFAPKRNVLPIIARKVQVFPSEETSTMENATSSLVH